MTKFKKTMSLLLALVMCVSMLNLTAFAEGDEEAHQHNPVACATCGGMGEVAEPVDMTPYEAAYAEFEAVAIEDNSQSIEANALAYLESHGIDPTDEFSITYAKYMVKAGDNAWSVDQIVNHGPYYDFVLMYEGDGTEESALANLEKYKPVAPIKTADTVDCPDCEDGTVACTGEFDDGVLTKNGDGTGTVTYTCATCNAFYDEPRTHAEVVEVLGDEGHVISGDATDHKDPTCAEEGYDKYVCAAEDCGAEFTVPIAKLKHSFKNHVCENCGALSFTIYGARMGYAYYYNGNPNAGAETYGYAGPAFGEGHTITMENLGRVDDRFGMFGEFVTNYATSKAWQCVGFVPAGFDYDAKDCLKLTYTNSEETGGFQYAESLDAVKDIIAEKGGVLYGAAPTDNGFIGRNGIVAVWFVDDRPIKPGQFGEYDLNVEPVAAPAAKENSTGVSIGIDPDSIVYVPASGSHAQGNYVRGSYTVDMVIRIDQSAPNNVHVNIAPGLAAAQEAILPKNGGAGFQPGDRVILNISIDNQSGRKYNYVSGSGFVATDLYANAYPDATVAGTGFDGFRIPAVDNSQYSYIARRTNNQPLKDLGLGKDVGDEAVGAALKRLGYGADSELSNEEIAQTYLADYYLDWINAARSVKELEPVGSFRDLGLVELSVFTNGDSGVQVFESCEDVVEGLYYFYYGAACTYNGKTIYQQMADYMNGVSELETAIPAALNGDDYDLNTLELDGEHVNNGFQNTQFSFRMEFDLTRVTPTNPTPTPTPDEPTPTPTPDEPTPTPTPEDPTPTPTPEEPTTTPIPDEPTPTEDIPDDETPLADIPDEESPLGALSEESVEMDIPDEDVPMAAVPKTGDQSIIWGVLTLLSGSGLLGMTFGRKRKNSEN